MFDQQFPDFQAVAARVICNNFGRYMSGNTFYSVANLDGRLVRTPPLIFTPDSRIKPRL